MNFEKFSDKDFITKNIFLIILFNIKILLIIYYYIIIIYLTFFILFISI